MVPRGRGSLPGPSGSVAPGGRRADQCPLLPSPICERGGRGCRSPTHERRAAGESRLSSALRGHPTAKARSRSPRAAERPAAPSGRPRRASKSFLAVLEALGRIDDELFALRDDLACFDVLAAAQAELPGDERVRQHLELLRSRLCARVDEMATKVGDVVYHFPNGSGSMPLAGHLVPDAPRQGEGSRVARDILTRAFALHARLLGELAALAEASESAAGLPLLAAPNADAVS